LPEQLKSIFSVIASLKQFIAEIDSKRKSAEHLSDTLQKDLDLYIKNNENQTDITLQKQADAEFYKQKCQSLEAKTKEIE